MPCINIPIYSPTLSYRHFFFVVTISQIIYCPSNFPFSICVFLPFRESSEWRENYHNYSYNWAVFVASAASVAPFFPSAKMVSLYGFFIFYDTGLCWESGVWMRCRMNRANHWGHSRNNYPSYGKSIYSLYSPPTTQMQCPRLRTLSQMELPPSTYTKEERGEKQDLYQHDNFPSLRLMTGTDCGDQGEHTKREVHSGVGWVLTSFLSLLET